MIMAVYLVGDDGDDSDVHVGREVAGDYDHGSLLFVVITVIVIGGDGGQDVGCEDGDDGPPVGGERAGLVRADRRRVAHRLARVQVPHQVVVAHHFLQNAFVKTVSNFVVAGSRIHQM